MAGKGSNVGNVYVTVVPTMRGFAREMNRQLSGVDVTQTGRKIGERMGGSMATAVSDKLVRSGSAMVMITPMMKPTATTCMAVLLSTPKSERMASPRKRNRTKMMNEKMAALPASTLRPLSFRPMITGVEPVMSITANSTMKALRISLKLKCSSIYYFECIACAMQKYEK